MFYLKLILGIIAVMCVVYAFCRPMDVLSWWWVKIKKACLWIYDLIKSWIK